MPANEKSAQQKSETDTSPLSNNPAPVDASEFRPFSSRDALYEKILEVPPQNSKFGSAGHAMKSAEREMTLRAMVKLLEVELESLKFEAITNQDKFALECLHTIAYESVRQLLLFCQVAPDMAAEIARQQQVWPVPYAKDTATKKAADILVDVLELGSKRDEIFDTGNMLSEITDARVWLATLTGLMNRLREEATVIAQAHEFLEKSDDLTTEIITGLESIPHRNASQEQMYEHFKSFVIDPDVLARLRQLFDVENPFAKTGTLRNFIDSSIRLPKLYADKQVVKLWIAVIRDLMMDVYDGHPEKSSLKWMGLYLARGKNDVFPEGTASYDSNIRSGMFAQLEKALMNIAKG